MQLNSDIFTGRGKKTQSGLTLVELMIAVAIGSVLMIGVIQLFSGMRGAYTLNESMSRVQENGRFAMEYLSSDLRMAGYMGCMSNPEMMNFHNDLEDEDDFLTQFMSGIQGYESRGTAPDDDVTVTALNPEPSTSASDWSPALPTRLAGEVVQGTDVVVVRYMSSDGVDLVPPVTNGTQWHTDGGGMYSQNTLLLTTDCAGRAMLYRRGNQSGGGDNDNIQPGGSIPVDFRNMGEEGEVARAVQAAYYIGVPESTGLPTLMRQVIDDAGSNLETEAVELVPGVEQMQVLYGVDTTGSKDSSGNFSVNRYVTADQVTNWGRVRSVRLSLLVRSESNLSDVDDPVRDFSLQRTNVSVDIQDELDRRNRRTFSTTVHLRNR